MVGHGRAPIWLDVSPWTYESLLRGKAEDMIDLLLSVVGHRNWQDLDVYARSAARCGFQGQKIVSVQDVPDDARAGLHENGFQIYDFGSSYPAGQHFQSLRYFVARDILLAAGQDEYRWVVWTDACDVVFQSDPIAALEHLRPAEIYAAKEGWLIRDQPINDVFIQRLELPQHEYLSLRQQEVLCSGTIVGRAPAMLLLFSRMCSLLERVGAMQGVDQGVFNYLARVEPFKSMIYIPEPEEGFVTTLGIFCAPSDRSTWTIEPPLLHRDSGLALTPDGTKPYAILHQYNRAYGPLNEDGAWRGIVERRWRG